MKRNGSTVLAAAGLVFATAAAAQVTFYEREGFRGESFVASDRIVPALRSFSIRDLLSGANVSNGGNLFVRIVIRDGDLLTSQSFTSARPSLSALATLPCRGRRAVATV